MVAKQRITHANMYNWDVLDGTDHESQWLSRGCDPFRYFCWQLHGHHFQRQFLHLGGADRVAADLWFSHSNVYRWQFLYWSYYDSAVCCTFDSEWYECR